MKTTANKQEPFVYGSLGGAVVTLVSLSKEERMELPASDADYIAARDYDSAAKIGTKQAWDAFLTKHPKGFYSDLTRAQLARLPKENDNRPGVSVEKKKTKNEAAALSPPSEKSVAAVEI
jgi:hypothetical protein